MFGVLPDKIHLLDAGAGMGSLTAAFVDEACSRRPRPTSIHVSAYEVDPAMASILEGTLKQCQEACADAGIEFTSTLVRDDFILCSAEPLLKPKGTVNCAILNPPYGKIRSNSQWRAALGAVGIETVNLYSAFVALALQQMSEGGELVAITPRSFCNGTYYEPFRRMLLNGAALLDLFVFQSRTEAFKDDDVLQENIIFRVQRGGAQGAVALSTDAGEVRTVPYEEIVRPDDNHSFIRLPVGGDGTPSLQGLPCTLEDLDIKVSTGRVVDFRARDHLRKDPEDGTVPLIYPGHMYNGGINWPRAEFKKNNAIADNDETASLMVPKGVYVLTKRFTSKEEKRRLVAAVYNGGKVGFENHLNYYHANGRGLDRDFASGLARYLNSTAVDQYFRTFSGHTQVNATDLRNIRYPTKDDLQKLGTTDDEPDRFVDRLLQASALNCFAGSS
ncbi:MAG: Eco57I restriction-modification methylase domain-containing protein [Alphaproteobacteria bacterium]